MVIMVQVAHAAPAPPEAQISDPVPKTNSQTINISVHLRRGRRGEKMQDIWAAAPPTSASGRGAGETTIERAKA